MFFSGTLAFILLSIMHYAMGEGLNRRPRDRGPGTEDHSPGTEEGMGPDPVIWDLGVPVIMFFLLHGNVTQ